VLFTEGYILVPNLGLDLRLILARGLGMPLSLDHGRGLWFVLVGAGFVLGFGRGLGLIIGPYLVCWLNKLGYQYADDPQGSSCTALERIWVGILV